MLEYLKKMWPHNFDTTRAGNEVFIIASEDMIHSDLIGESNVERISEDFDWTHTHGQAYSRYVGVFVDILDEDTVEELEDLMKALDYYPLYDDNDHSDREQAALQEYMGDGLAQDMAYELVGHYRDDELIAKLQAWIDLNIEEVWEYNDGSVDDAPFNTRAMAEDYKTAKV